MKTTITLEGLHFHSFHGYYEEERKMGNPFVLDVSVDVKSFDSFDDDIGDTVNYEDLFQICKEEMAETKKLLETVVLHIIKRIQKKYPEVENGEVSLQKIGPQLGGKVDKAVIKMSF